MKIIFRNNFPNPKCESSTGCLIIKIMSTDYALEHGFQDGLQNPLCNSTGYSRKKEGFGLSIGNDSLIQFFPLSVLTAVKEFIYFS